MESLKIVGSMINNLVKASYSISNTVDLLTDLENQMLPFFRQMQEDVAALEQANKKLSQENENLKAMVAHSCNKSDSKSDNE